MTKSTGFRDRRRQETVFVAFSRKVVRSDPSVCWWWPGATLGTYGQINHHRRQYYAHRVSYEAHIGGIPAGLDVCHSCDNPSCVNPDHLFLGTASDNALDMVAKGRDGHGEMRGVEHPLAKLNEAKVRLIRGWQGSLKALAAELGVAHSLVHRVKHRRSWAHVAD